MALVPVQPCWTAKLLALTTSWIPNPEAGHSSLETDGTSPTPQPFESVVLSPTIQPLEINHSVGLFVPDDQPQSPKKNLLQAFDNVSVRYMDLDHINNSE
jgi:hypothetical protein